jgi:DNA-binding transcriptional LysR family regulator
MNLHELQTFVSIARLGGLTRAAGQLHRSQPAITRRIKLLEDQLAPIIRGSRRLAMQAQGISRVDGGGLWDIGDAFGG